MIKNKEYKQYTFLNIKQAQYCPTFIYVTVLIVTYLKSKEKLNCGKKSVLFMYMIISNTFFFKKGGSKYLAPPPTPPSQTLNLSSVKMYCRLQWWRNYLIYNVTFCFLLVGNITITNCR